MIWTIARHILTWLSFESLDSKKPSELPWTTMLREMDTSEPYALSNYVTFLRFLKQRITSDLNNNLYLYYV